MDILFPPDLSPSAMMMGVDDFTAVDESATTGGMQSSALFGTRRWHLRMDFEILSRSNGSLARFEAFTAALRGRGNRVWIGLAQQKLRGSFPAVEMFANNDFSGGLTSWSTDAQNSISALDHAVRVTRAKVTANSSALAQSVSLTAGIPFAIRGFINGGKGGRSMQMADTAFSGYTPSTSQGMMEGCFATRGNVTGPFGILDSDASGTIAGNFFDMRWTSLSRCAQVDNGVNLLTFSDDLTNAAWLTSGLTPSAGALVGPDGIVEATTLTENTASSVSHAADRLVTVPSTALDYTFGIFASARTRGWMALVLEETTGPSQISQFFNVSTGVLGTGVSGTNFTLIKSTITDYGNGWFYCTITGRKTNAATTIEPAIFTSTADTVFTYAGTNGLAAIQVWRATLAQSSVAVQPTQTAGAAQAGTLQTGFNLNLKGLPVSTQGLLLEGDVVECLQPVNSQLLRVVSRLDSDAAGLGTLIFENALKQSPVDGAGIVVQQPMGRWVLASSTLGIEYTPGVFGQASLEFVEAA